MSSLPPLTPTEFEALMRDIRPELHRYATRMTGSIFDGEDVVQEALIKANASFSTLSSSTNIRGWLFTITHNKAIDHLRRHHDEPLELLDETLITKEAEPDLPLEEKELAIIALSVFLKLTPKQRSCVILKDVLGYSLVEISELLNATIPEIKAALHRGRTHLRGLSAEVNQPLPTLDEHEQALLTRYVDRFNARDFDAVRAMLAEEVQLDVMGRAKMRGLAEVNKTYYRNYSQQDDWHLTLGVVEGRLAVLVYDPRELSSASVDPTSDSLTSVAPTSVDPTYFMLVTWDNQQISHIRDYRYVRYIMHGLTIVSR